MLPAVIAIAMGAAAGLVRWPVQPMLAVRVLTAIALVVAVTALSVLTVIVAGFASRSALMESLVDWCPAVPLHQVGVLQGGIAILLLGVASARSCRVLRTRRRAGAGTEGRSLAVIDSIEPIAFAAPGKPGCVVVSRGLLDALDVRERQVVLAHERAHLHHNHHRYLLAAELTVAIVPVLRPLARQIRFATERSADESAADAMGGDRRLVARAIARAAVARSVHAGLVGSFGGGAVPLRVSALIGPRRAGAVVVSGIGVVIVAAAVTIVAGSIQLQQLMALIGHVCHLD